MSTVLIGYKGIIVLYMIQIFSLIIINVYKYWGTICESVPLKHINCYNFDERNIEGLCLFSCFLVHSCWQLFNLENVMGIRM
jgi:hypothetical protein